ncbi:MAG: hypothetical protein HYV40_04565, partial [Candidatus Levybacteria bacterium]|nr:hypothetical protein [Candidatus Levybacteria bacterium]
MRRNSFFHYHLSFGLIQGILLFSLLFFMMGYFSPSYAQVCSGGGNAGRRYYSCSKNALNQYYCAGPFTVPEYKSCFVTAISGACIRATSWSDNIGCNVGDGSYCYLIYGDDDTTFGDAGCYWDYGGGSDGGYGDGGYGDG